MRQQAHATSGGVLAGAIALLALVTPVAAQETAVQDSPWAAPTSDEGVKASLIQQDQSDCLNTTVQDDPNRIRGGEIFITPAGGGNIDVQVALTADANTTYNVYLKCVRQIGVLVTTDDAIAVETFTIPDPGAQFAFDIYPDGAPSGNKFQSMTVNMPQ
jgi:hypothetical protein